MKKIDLIELSLIELKQINGGTDEVAYKLGYAAGMVAGKMVRSFLTMTGIWKVVVML